ncbi:MAG: ABC transporter permease, partial [Bryobacteraceae bacterium]
MSALTQDLRYALRTLLNSPGSTAVAVFVLSLGIGANTAIFSVTSAILFRALPYKHPERVVVVWENNRSKGMRQQLVTAEDY